ncbi:aspartate kinase [Maledivibacter halophilus]|uniref:Aspartokinase n=1 Tax=Maledivibacter halophilus TaxID=36842 RepID=A0A1T5MSQ3_9FIRM|nr:aspartate kinase [Maledivibacter halophilus]SKC91235.1 aspartate kinase [Maledivibacter halophilus]
MAIVVQKYGGTSVGTIDKIKNIAKRIAKRKKQGDDIVVVVSAMGKTTDILLEMANEISSNPDKRELDMLISTGEQVSIALLTIALKELGYDAISLTGPQAGIITVGFHTKARIDDIDIKNVKTNVGRGKIVVVAGFQGVDEEGNITTLGRGGSDTTAVALAAKLDAICEIYTDVDGIYTVDPRLFSTAKKLDNICYEEMVEMASLGAGVMETRSIEIAQRFNVPIYVALSSEEWPGTYIKEFDESMESKVITGLSVSDDDIMITINDVPNEIGNIAMVFEKLASNDINIDMISQTAPSRGYINISFTVPKSDKFLVDKVLEKIKNKLTGIEINIEEDITKLSVVGIGMKSQSGVAAKMFKIFADNKIEFKQVTTSEIRISYTINTNDKEKAVVAVAKEFNL